jgi:hypothetical protein
VDRNEVGITHEVEERYFSGDTRKDELLSTMSAMDTSSGEKDSVDCGYSESVEETESMVMMAKEEKSIARPLRLLHRDEWECDFCGPECFCDWVVKVEAFGEAMC